MPTYEYQCDACGHEFEREQRITEDPIKTCPECKARKARRLISRTSFVLKGGGWYSDLYASPSAKKEADKGADAKPESKSDAKPDADSGAKDGKSGDSKTADKGDGTAKGKKAKSAA